MKRFEKYQRRAAEIRPMLIASAIKALEGFAGEANDEIFRFIMSAPERERLGRVEAVLQMFADSESDADLKAKLQVLNRDVPRRGEPGAPPETSGRVAVTDVVRQG